MISTLFVWLPVVRSSAFNCRSTVNLNMRGRRSFLGCVAIAEQPLAATPPGWISSVRPSGQIFFEQSGLHDACMESTAVFAHLTRTIGVLSSEAFYAHLTPNSQAASPQIWAHMQETCPIRMCHVGARRNAVAPQRPFSLRCGLPRSESVCGGLL